MDGARSFGKTKLPTFTHCFILQHQIAILRRAGLCKERHTMHITTAPHLGNSPFPARLTTLHQKADIEMHITAPHAAKALWAGRPDSASTGYPSHT